MREWFREAVKVYKTDVIERPVGASTMATFESGMLFGLDHTGGNAQVYERQSRVSSKVSQG